MPPSKAKGKASKESSKGKETQKSMKQAKKVSTTYANSTTSLDKTRNLFDETRMTVEVLDDASPDVTPRPGYDMKKSRMKNIADDIDQLKSIQKHENYYRKTSFADEKTRVNDSKDIFVSAPGISADDVRKERERLNKLEESARLKKLYSDAEVTHRKQHLEKDKAALKFQAAFRGHIGRQRFKLSQRLKEIDDEKLDWIEVRDRQTGDMWFYNKRTGVSQWERPEELEATLTSSTALKKLPNISRGNSAESSRKSSFLEKARNLSVSMSLPSLDATTLAKAAAHDSLSNSKTFNLASSVDTSMVNTSRQTEEEIKQANKEVDAMLGFDKLTPSDNLSAPDGSFKPQLRSLVLDTLVTTRFDSVSSVLCDERWMDSEGDKFGAFEAKSRQGRVSTASASTRPDNTRKPIVAVVTFNKKEKRSRPITVDSSGERPSRGSKSLSVTDLSVKDIEHPGFVASHEVQGADLGKEKEMCFGCWSAGHSRACALHEDKNNPTKLQKSQTMLLCRNWELGIMRRRYRAEEIQERFGRKGPSLRYDTKFKKFFTVVELKHPIYRDLVGMVEKFNNRVLLFLKIKRWLFTMAEQVRLGHMKSQKAIEQSQMMRLKRSMVHRRQVDRHTNEVRAFLPVPPFTGTSWPELTGAIQYLFKHPDQAVGHEVELILSFPIPKHKFLYLTHECHLSVPRSIPMPRPHYDKDKVANMAPGNKFVDELNMGAWFERLCSAISRDACVAAKCQVDAVTPEPGSELVRRSKQPTPCTIKFATLGRKPVPGNLDVIALPTELLISQLISTYVPPQYGNFMIMEKSTVSPGVTVEVMITFESLLCPPGRQVYVSRPVEHPLNYRRTPTITVNSKVKPDNKHLYGLNRPDQTGERESHGFRTTAWTFNVLIAIDTDPYAFTPSAEVVTLNHPVANIPVSTHTDLRYPFCQPSTRENSTLDFYHLLLTGHVSPGKSQVFTALTVQEPGLFLKDSRDDLPLGHLVVSVYRSWAFTQKDTIEEFKTDDGIPYWYHRRTGQTFWERPLAEDETISPLKGGTLLDMGHPEEPLTIHKGHEGGERRYLQGDFRKLMLTHRETDKEAEKRRVDTSKSARHARMRGVLPDEPPAELIAKRQKSSKNDEDMVAVPNRVVKASSADEEEEQRQLIAKQRQQAQEGRGWDNASVGTHESTESTLFNDHGKLRPMTSPMREQTKALAAASVKEVGGGDSVGSLQSQAASGVGQGVDVPRSSIAPPSVGPPKGPNVLQGIDSTLIENLTNNLAKMMSVMMSDTSSPQDMISLGMGMGMALLSSGAVQGVADKKAEKSNCEVYNIAEDGSDVNSNGAEFGSRTRKEEESVFPHLTDDEVAQAFAHREATVEKEREAARRSNAFPLHRAPREEPIGEPYAVTIFSSDKTLDRHESTTQEQDHYDKINAPLDSLDAAKQMKIQQPTVTPDEVPVKELTVKLPKNAEEAAKEKIPLLVYPELSSLPDRDMVESRLHPAAGAGTSFLLKEDAEGAEFVDGTGGFLRKAVMPLPVGFFEAIVARRVAKQEVEYLPQVPNLPQTRNIGRVKPRSAAVDWLAVSFDPWSAGKSPLNTEFLPSLTAKADKFFAGGAAVAGDIMDRMREETVGDAYLTIADAEGLAEKRQVISKATVMADDFKKICSLSRHGKYSDVEALINQIDWSLPIDYQDDCGNTLLHVVAQNGNKRCVKLCLRRGADINVQNLNGQTPLHFAFGYGYQEVGDYLLKKGADDSIRNKDGLTCYEGLGARELQLL